MSEILFRGQDARTKEWRFGSLIDFDKESGYRLIVEPYHNASTIPLYYLMKEHAHFVVPETIDQYTGLKDKNGKRIFEGDVVRWTSENTYLTSNYVYDRRAYGYGSVLIVTSLESGFTLRPIKDNAPDIPNANCKIDNYTFWNHHNQLEVIGNIHDNPELLEG